MTQEDWRDIFASNLADNMREHRMSQNRLAREAGLSASRINDYLNRRAVPSIFAVINLAYALDVDVDSLVDFGECIY